MSQLFYKSILSGLVTNREFFKASLPYLKKDYFEDADAALIFEKIAKYGNEYKKPPSYDVLDIEFSDASGIEEKRFDGVKSMLNELKEMPEPDNPSWLLKKTEDFCKDRAIFNAIMESLSIIDGNDKKRERGIIPTLLSDALAVSFDTALGHDYFDDAEERFKAYREKNEKIPFSSSILNKATGGGAERKTLNLYLAPSNAGKSAVMCSDAAYWLSLGYNVLYITMELAEKKVGHRIDANLFNLPMDQVPTVTDSFFNTKMNQLKKKTHGKLKIKEFPTGGASSAHFRVLLDEYKLKHDFVPDIVIVDYMGIVASASYKSGSNANTYTIQKSVSEELRALAVEYNAAFFSAVQGNRSSFGSSDLDATSIAESIGVIATADLVIGLIQTPELDEMSQMMFKQIKSRYGDVSFLNKFLVGFDRPRMRVYDIENQDGIINEIQERPEIKHIDEQYDVISNNDEVKKSSVPLHGKAGKLASPDWEY